MSLQKYKDLFLPTLVPMICFGVITTFVFFSAAATASIKIIGSFCISMALFAYIRACDFCTKKSSTRIALESKDKYTCLAHALRTPLATICGVAEIFEATQNNLDENQKSLVSTLSANAAEIKTLIADSDKV